MWWSQFSQGSFCKYVIVLLARSNNLFPKLRPRTFTILTTFTSLVCLQGVKVNSGKSLGSKFGRIQCLHCNKRYLSRKSLISALIWHPESGCGTIRRLPRPHRRQEVKNPPRGPMLFAARGRDALLIMPRPLSGCQMKAEIKGFLLMYRLFLY